MNAAGLLGVQAPDVVLLDVPAGRPVVAVVERLHPEIRLQAGGNARLDGLSLWAPIPAGRPFLRMRSSARPIVSTFPSFAEAVGDPPVHVAGVRPDVHGQLRPRDHVALVAAVGDELDLAALAPPVGVDHAGELGVRAGTC